MAIDSIRTSHFNSYPTSYTTRNGPVGSEEQSAAKGELPATQIFPTAADEKAGNERSPDTDKAKQEAANRSLADINKEAQAKQKPVKKPGEGTRGADAKDGGKQGDDGDGDETTDTRQAKNDAATPENSRKLSDEELQQVQQLSKRDLEVHLHESAHLAAAGQYARGAASYSYETGPDGKRYAVGGEVHIDTSPVPNDPQATLQKANAIRAAALAPAEPSGQDRSVAIEAMRMASKARSEIFANDFGGNDETSKTEQTGKSDEPEANTVKQAHSTSKSESDAKLENTQDSGSPDVKAKAESEGAAQKYIQVANNAKGREAEQPTLNLLA